MHGNFSAVDRLMKIEGQVRYNTIMQDEWTSYGEHLDELASLSFDDFLVQYQEWVAQPGKAEGLEGYPSAPLAFAAYLIGVPHASAPPAIEAKFNQVKEKLDQYGKRYAEGILRTNNT